MKSYKNWNEFYSKNNHHFLALISNKPTIAVKKLLEVEKIKSDSKILEIGCGVGRNTNYLSQQGLKVSGIDISPLAIDEAKKRTDEIGADVSYIAMNACNRLPFKDFEFDHILDLMTSHLFSLKNLQTYKEELLRIIKPDGKFVLYVPDLTKDSNTKQLLQEAPGKEEDTYILPGMGHTERAFSKETIEKYYSPFRIKYAELIYNPTNFDDKIYEKYYWFAILEK
jgi:SAM-dependent methyltransferase